MKYTIEDNLFYYKIPLDIPCIMLCAASLLCYFMGIIFSSFIFLGTSIAHLSWDWSTFFAGLIFLGIGIGIDIFAFAYWWLIPRRILKFPIPKGGIIVGLVLGLLMGFSVFAMTLNLTGVS